MDARRKSRIAMIIGVICLIAGAVNIGLYFVGRPESGSALSASGIGAFTLGIIMVSLARKNSEPGA